MGPLLFIMPSVLRSLLRDSMRGNGDGERAGIHGGIRKYRVVGVMVGSERIALHDMDMLTCKLSGPPETRFRVVVAYIDYQSIALPVAPRICIPELDVIGQMRATVE